MPHPENIIPPKKGEIRNPKGRGHVPDGLLSIIRRKLKTNPNVNILSILQAKGIAVDHLKNKPAGAGVAEALMAEMLAGNANAILGYISRTEEPPKQALGIDHSGEINISIAPERAGEIVGNIIGHRQSLIIPVPTNGNGNGNGYTNGNGNGNGHTH